MDGAWSCKRWPETSWERRRDLSLEEAHESGSSHAEGGRFPGLNYHGLSVSLFTPPPTAVFCLIFFLFPHLTAVNCTLTRTHDCLYVSAGEDICPCFHNFVSVLSETWIHNCQVTLHRCLVMHRKYRTENIGLLLLIIIIIIISKVLHVRHATVIIRLQRKVRCAAR